MADAITEAQKLYSDSMDALREQRDQITEDLAFSDPSDPQQWDEIERRQRETDPGGSRPCLTFDQTGQYVANVAGQVEQRPPAIHSIPASDGDRQVAEKLDGLFRNIEHSSRAAQHYARALTSAARAGVGYLIIRPEYTDRALGYMEPRISSEGDPLRVVFDPWSVELDGSDANFGFLLTPLSHAEFERQFPKADKVSFGDEERKMVRDGRESIVVAEQWTIEESVKNVIVVGLENGDQASMSEDEFWQARQNGQIIQPLHTFKDKTREVWWRKMSGATVLEESKDADGKVKPYPADGIGIVPVYGYVGWSGGRMTYCGIPRRARNPQRAYNFHMSEARAYMATAPKSPWIVSKRAIRGVEALWDRAAADQRAYLPFNDIDEEGNPVPAPQRMPVAVNVTNHVQGAEQAKQDIQASIGMYQANLGAPSNESSGVAIENRKQQGEASTAHFPSHLSAALGQVGRLCLQMIPRVIDTRRQLRILGIDQTPSQVTIDPKQAEAVAENETGISINPCIGHYDVRVVTGASFSTQRQQAQQAYTEMMRAAPGLIPAIAPLWAQTLDVPHADKLAQVLTAVAPEPVKAILQPDEQVGPAQLKAKLDQMGQALQEAIQHAKDAQADADEAHQQLASKEDEAEAKERELDIKAYAAKTDRLKVTGANEEQIKAIVADLLGSLLSQPEPLPGEHMPEEPTEGPGPDGSAPHEQAEGEQPESHEMQPLPAGGALDEVMQ